MEVRAALRSERDEVLDLLALWFDNRAFFALYNHNDPKFRDDLCLIARDGRKLVATVQIFDRPINLGGATVPMGGIGSVFTRKDYRHQRIASALMRLAVKTLEREGFELSMLFTERLTFYRQFGWREVARKFSILPRAHAIHADAPIELASFVASGDLAAVMAIHGAYSGRFNLTAVRDDADWRANLLFAANQERDAGDAGAETFLVARTAGAIRAYARAALFHGVPMVMEYGYLPGAIDAMLSLLRRLGETAAGGEPSLSGVGGPGRRSPLFVADGPDGAARPLIAHTAHDPDLEARLAATGAAVTYHEDRNFMWRVVSPERLARRIDATPDTASARFLEIATSPRALFWTADRF
ncbi:MAG: GNAT family N-acetyltransferase [Candidatus Binataceae bacterium]